jgi:phosphonate transport system ATP-binding protein
LIEFRGVSKAFPNGVQALKEVTLTIDDGDFVIVVGLSGAGKSTLLRCINRLVEPTGGRVIVNGIDVTACNPEELRKARTQVGMIFQNFNLVKRSPVLTNVLAGRLGHMTPSRGLLGLFSPADISLALSCLDRVDIRDKAYVRADQLSGGQQQRVGIARALAQEPKVILADEPVASLDPPTSHTVMRDLQRINREDGITTIVNLHFIDLAQQYGRRIIGLRAGEVVFDGPASSVNEQTFEDIYGRRIKDTDLRGANEEKP